MNKVFKKTLREHTPTINKKITDGTVKDILASMSSYLDKFFSSSIASLSPNINFEYLGSRRVAPKEEYIKMVLSREGIVSYDLSRNNVYLVEFRFEYEGKLITRPIYLPYAEDGNILIMGGANYHITPVLSDTVISPSDTGVFIRLLKAKLNFTARSRYFIVNGNKVAGNLIHGVVLKPNSKQITDRIGRPMTATSLYLLGKYGLAETLKKHGNVDKVIVTTEDVPYLPNEYIVYESTKIKPRGLKAIPYAPHNVKIVIYGTNINRAFVDNMIYGVIYTLDILPEIEQDIVSLVTGGNLTTEIEFWRIILGKIIYKNSFSIDRISQDLDSHFNALETYVDKSIVDKLANLGTGINNFFDLLAFLISNYNSLVLNNKEYNSNIENRYIDILYYLTYDIVIGFNRAILGLNKRATKVDKIGYKEVVKILTNELGVKKVYSLTRSKEPNLSITGIDYSGDIKYPKITSILEDQSRGNGVHRGKKTALPPSCRTLHASDLGFGSLLFLGKNLPSPRFKLNIFMQYNTQTGKIQYPDDIKRTLKKLGARLQGIPPNKAANLLKNELMSEDEALIELGE